MPSITPYIIVAFYFVAAFFLVFVYRKENRCFLYIGIAFFILGIWDVLKLTAVKELNSGFYPWIPKIVCIGVLIYACIVYISERRKAEESSKIDPRALQIPPELLNTADLDEENNEEE